MSECAGKVGYGSEGEAKRALRRVQGQRKGRKVYGHTRRAEAGLHPYRCACGAWHLGRG